ncbi:MAG TPA: hypothetical protein VHM92_00465 [Allosphingosinicella sp.]|nr:hypothetical protein [Allosphingosinicella sp.]
MAHRESEKVVVAETGRGGGGTAIAIVIGILLLIVLLYFLFGRGLLSGTSTEKIDADVKIDAPSSK